MKLWYISFADDEGFRGGVFVKAVNFLDALRKTHRLEINPGGEALGGIVSEDDYPAEYHNRIISEKELRILFDFRRRDEWEKEWKKEENA